MKEICQLYNDVVFLLSTGCKVSGNKLHITEAMKGRNKWKCIAWNRPNHNEIIHSDFIAGMYCAMKNKKPNPFSI